MMLLVALILATWFLVFCELLLPGGILGILAFGLGSYAVWHTYQLFGGLTAGLLGAGLLVSNLLLVIFGFKYWVRSPLAKGFMLKTSLRAGSSSSQPQAQLLGQGGESLTALNPSGKVLIAAQVYDAYSQDGYIDQGVRIEVIDRNNFGLIIKKS